MFGISRKDKNDKEVETTFKPLNNFHCRFEEDFASLIDDIAISFTAIQGRFSGLEKSPVNDSAITEMIKEESNRVLNNISDYYYNLLLHYKTENGIIDFIVSQLTILTVKAGIEYNKGVLYNNSIEKE